MKTIIIIAISILLVGCAIPSNPKMSFGKKCHVADDNVTYSYVWLYDEDQGLKATEAQCIHISK